MKKSIINNGILQPIIVGRDENGFFLISGKHRLYAARLAGKITIPCVLSKGDPLEISLIENVYRKDLTVIQEMEAFIKIKEKLRLSQKDMANKFNRSTTNMNDILQLKKLPEKIITQCRNDSKFSRRFFLEILEEKDHDEMMSQYYEKIKKNNTNKSRKVNNSESKKSTSKIKQSPQKLVLKRLHGAISAAVKMASVELSEDELYEMNKLYKALGDLLTI